MNDPKHDIILVSAIVPCHNFGLYIHHTVDSLLSQTPGVNEIIIVDDGSTDEFTLEQLKKYEDHPLVRVIYSENLGPSSARNIGFSHSQGRYLLLCDGDDMFREDFVAKAVTLLDDYPLLGAVSSWTLCFGEVDFVWFPMGGSVQNFISSITCPCAGLVRREAWVDSGGFDVSYKIGYEDWDFWLRVTKKGWLIHIIPELLFYYRQKKESRVKNTFQNHDEIYKDQIMQNHPDVFKNILSQSVTT